MLGNGKSEKIPYISGNVTFLYFRKQNFCSSKNEKNLLRKNFLNFRKWNFLDPSLKNFLHFRG